MKKFIIPLIFLLAVLAMGATDVFVDTPKKAWTNIGTIDAIVAQADSALGVTERSYATNSVLANVVVYNAPAQSNFVTVRFSMATNNSDFYIDVYAKGYGEDNLQRICTLTIANGQQSNTESATLKFADTITISNEAWIGDIWTVAPGTDHMATLNLDLAGYDALLFHAHGICDEECTVEVRSY